MEVFGLAVVALASPKFHRYLKFKLLSTILEVSEKVAKALYKQASGNENPTTGKGLFVKLIESDTLQPFSVVKFKIGR